MTYRGRVRNGSLILDEPVTLPEGAEVEVTVIVYDDPQSECAPDGHSQPKALMEFAGKATGLPPDASRNMDHYLCGLTGLEQEVTTERKRNHDH